MPEPSRTPVPKPDDKTGLYQEYAVLWVDVLGQARAIQRLEDATRRSLKRDKLLPALREAVGKVETVRESIRKYFDAYESAPPKFSALALPREDREIYRRLQKRPLATIAFADTIIAYAPLGSMSGHSRTCELYALLGACCSTMLYCNAAHIAVRGALAVGYAYSMRDGDPYGPAWLRAYCAEEDQAKWMRIVVGDGVQEFLKRAANDRRSDAEAKVYRELAAKCSEVIGRCHGETYVDYLGPGFRQWPVADKMVDAVKTGLEFAKGQEQQLLGAGDTKMAPKYRELRQYYEARIDAWK